MSTCSRRQFTLGSLASAVLASGCCPRPYSSTYAWNNALRTDGIDPRLLAEPGSLRDLIELIQRAEREHVGVRMTGSGHSFSDVALSSGFMLKPYRLASLLELDRSQLKAAYRDDAGLVRTQSGIRLRSLNAQLFTLGRALENMGGWDAQTIVGAAITGTHGSGLGYGPIASQIMSLQIVTKGGQVLQVEPSDGMTDRAKFPEYIDTPEGRFPMLLEQNDETFNALTVSMGCMGVVYAVVLRTVPRFWLREVRELTTWGELKRPGGFLQRLMSRERLEPAAAADPDYYEIYFNPYPPKGGGGPDAHRCILTKRYRVLEEPGRLTVEARSRGRFGADLTSTLAMVTGRGDSLVDFINAHPEQMPGAIDQALEALKDREFVDVSYNVFNFGPANLFRVMGVELAFDLAQTIAATERHFALAAELRERDIVHTTPPSLRFVKRSDAFLAMMNGRDTTMLEMGMLVGASGAERLLKTFETKYIEEFAARPHWGLDLRVLQDFSEVKRLFPAADRWRAVYDRFNKSGTFNAELTDRLGISAESGS